MCDNCRAPLHVTPSAALFRGSLIVVAVAALLGIWALIAPPSLPGERRVAASAAQNPAAVHSRPTQGNPAQFVPTPGASPSPIQSAMRTYTVAFGDTLSGIAQNFGTTIEAIEQANPGVTPATLKAGQQLLIPPPPTPSTTPASSPTPSPSPSPSPTPSPTPSPSPTASPTAAVSPAASPAQ